MLLRHEATCLENHHVDTDNSSRFAAATAACMSVTMRVEQHEQHPKPGKMPGSLEQYNILVKPSQVIITTNGCVSCMHTWAGILRSSWCMRLPTYREAESPMSGCRRRLTTCSRPCSLSWGLLHPHDSISTPAMPISVLHNQSSNRSNNNQPIQLTVHRISMVGGDS